MKKQLLTLLVVALISNSTFALNRALNTYSAGYGATSTYPLTGVSAFTFEAWFNGAPGTTYARIFSFSNYAFEVSAGNGTISIYDGAWRATGVTGMGSGWHHVAVTNDLTNFVVYVDGTQVYTKASVARDFTGQVMNIGHDAKNHTANQRFPGKFDEVRVWNRALSSLEIAILRIQQLTGNENGLVCYYNFNDATGNNKATGGSHNLGLVSPSYVTTNYIDYVKDYTLNLEGTDDKTFINPTPLLSNSDFTIEMQFKTNATDASLRRLISFTLYGCDVAISNGVIKSYIVSGSWVTIGSASGFNDDQWHHFALSKNGTTLSFYVDGNLIGTRTATLNLSGYAYFGGSQTTQAADLFKGSIDEIRIWNVAKTQPQIEASMATEVDAAATNLISYFDFNAPTGATVIPNQVTGATGLTRSGPAGTNTYPQFVASVKNTITTSISEIFNAKNEVLSVYPNPVNDFVNINVSGLSQVLVVDASGKEVLNFNTNSSQIDLSSLTQGIYFLQVLNNEEIKTAKIIKN